MSRDPVPWPWQEDGLEPPACEVVQWWLAHPRFQPDVLDPAVARSLISEYFETRAGLSALDADTAGRVLDDLLTGPGLEGLDLSRGGLDVAWAYHLRRVARFADAEQELSGYFDAVLAGDADDMAAITHQVARDGVDQETAAGWWREDTLHDRHIDLGGLRARYPDVADWEVTAYRAAGSSGGSADWAENVSGTLRNYRIPPAVDLARLIARLQAYVTRYQQYLPDHAPGTSLDDPLKRIADATAAMAQAAGEALAVLGEQPGRSQQPPGTRRQAIAPAARRPGSAADLAFSGTPPPQRPPGRHGRLPGGAAATLRRMIRTGRVR